MPEPLPYDQALSTVVQNTPHSYSVGIDVTVTEEDIRRIQRTFMRDEDEARLMNEAWHYRFMHSVTPVCAVDPDHRVVKMTLAGQASWFCKTDGANLGEATDA